MSRKKIILHIGLPKTGTTALQHWCNSNRAQLKKFDINYPAVNKNLPDPKHQYLVRALHKNNLKKICRILDENSANTIVFSAEGLTNGFYNFPSEALRTFRKITSNYEVTVFMVKREYVSWTKSLHKQVVLNPPSAIQYNATSLKYEEFCQLPRIIKLANTSTLTEDLKFAFGAKEVVIAQYEEDWMNTFIGILGITDLSEMVNIKRANVSVSDDIVELVRQINAMQLPTYTRARFLNIIQSCFGSEHTQLNNYANIYGTFLRRIFTGIYNSIGLTFFSRYNNEQILQRLQSGNPKQAELIDKLAKFLNKPSVA